VWVASAKFRLHLRCSLRWVILLRKGGEEVSSNQRPENVEEARQVFEIRRVPFLSSPPCPPCSLACHRLVCLFPLGVRLGYARKARTTPHCLLFSGSGRGRVDVCWTFVSSMGHDLSPALPHALACPTSRSRRHLLILTPTLISPHHITDTDTGSTMLRALVFCALVAFVRSPPSPPPPSSNQCVLYCTVLHYTPSPLLITRLHSAALFVCYKRCLTLTPRPLPLYHAEPGR